MTEKEIDDLIELEGENMFLPKDKIETKTELEKKDDKKPEETKKRTRIKRCLKLTLTAQVPADHRTH
jgi:hypothetical protein